MKTKPETTEQVVADAMRKVADMLLTAIDEKYINRNSVDADILFETLMAVADELDPE
jgi:hypothetical protein